MINVPPPAKSQIIDTLKPELVKVLADLNLVGITEEDFKIELTSIGSNIAGSVKFPMFFIEHDVLATDPWWFLTLAELSAENRVTSVKLLCDTVLQRTGFFLARRIDRIAEYISDPAKMSAIVDQRGIPLGRDVHDSFGFWFMAEV